MTTPSLQLKEYDNPQDADYDAAVAHRDAFLQSMDDIAEPDQEKLSKAEKYHLKRSAQRGDPEDRQRIGDVDSHSAQLHLMRPQYR